MDKALKNRDRVSNREVVSNTELIVGEQTSISVNDNARATAADIANAIALIERSFAIQQERIQIIADAAVLALEQVQDKRLEMSEKGKTVRIEDVIFDLLSIYLWEVGFIGHVLKPLVMEVTRTICTRSLKYSFVYDQLSKSDYGAQLIGYARLEKNSKALLQQIIAEHVTNASQFNSEDFAMFSKKVRELRDSAPELFWKKATGTVAKWKDIKKKVKETNLAMTDSPGVSMLKAAQSYVSSHRFALKSQQAGIVALIRSQESMTVLELRLFMSIFQIEELPDTDFIRDQYQWTYEMIIWARMYGFTKDSATSPGVWTNSFKGFKGIPTDLTNYWLERFREVMISYSRGFHVNWDEMTYVGKVTTLRNYFMKIMEHMDEKSKVTGPIEAAFQVTSIEVEDE